MRREEQTQEEKQGGRGPPPFAQVLNAVVLQTANSFQPRYLKNEQRR